MRCESFCVTGSYDLQAIADSFANKGYAINQHGKKVLHLSKIANQKCDIFIFSHGSLVTWGVDEAESYKVIAELKPFANNPLTHIETGSFEFRYGDETKFFVDKKLNQDVIILESSDPSIKLAVSYGLAQSIKLESFEQTVENAVNKNVYLAHELSSRGKIPLTRREISKCIGEIFKVKSLVNLNSEYLDIPEYFWERSALENYYIITIKFLDLNKRVAALNQRLNVLQDLFDVLNNQLQHSHSTTLEWTIIILIFIEIIIMLIYYTV
ncbi:MAG: RMD1 family protein [Gammaproteobacteria bacterium]|jgi:uncharacterized Rmd1/YagE family protein